MQFPPKRRLSVDADLLKQVTSLYDGGMDISDNYVMSVHCCLHWQGQFVRQNGLPQSRRIRCIFDQLHRKIESIVYFCLASFCRTWFALLGPFIFLLPLWMTRKCTPFSRTGEHPKEGYQMGRLTGGRRIRTGDPHFRKQWSYPLDHRRIVNLSTCVCVRKENRVT